jgi:protein O-mannosyl-transferase
MPRYRLEFLLSLLLIALTIGAMGGVWENGFVNYDDETYVVNNPHLRAGLTSAGLAWAFTSTYAGNWHPLTWVSYLLEYEFFGLSQGLNPTICHLTNLVIHVASVVALFLTLRRMTGTVWRSACVAALFGCHPLHVESVAWVAERKDVLSGLFFVLTLAAYVNYVDRRGSRRYLAMAACYALGLMAKPMLVTLPFFLLLLDYWPLERWKPWAAPSAITPRRPKSVVARQPVAFSRLLIEKAPLFGLAAVSCAMTLYAQQASGAVRSFEQLPFGLRIENAVLAYVYYLSKLLWPVDLAVYYPYLTSGSSALQVVADGSFLIAASVLAVLLGRRHPYLPVGWFWYIGTLVPVIGLVQVGAQGMADRYTYIPLIGIFLVIVWGVADLAPQRPPSAVWLVPLTGALGACVMLSRAQVAYWHDSVALWSHALSTTGSNFIAENNLGLALSEQPGKLAEAEAHFAAAARASPASDEAEGNLGMTELAQGKLNDAVGHLSRALALNESSAKTHNNLGLVLLYQGKSDAALAHFSRALQLEPSTVAARGNRGLALLQLGKPAEAIKELESYVRDKRANPNQPVYLSSLALAYSQVGRFDEAVGAARQALAVARAMGRPDLVIQIEANVRAYERHQVPPDAQPGR